MPAFFFRERDRSSGYDFRFQAEEELEVEPPLTKTARFASVDNAAMDQLDRDRVPRGTVKRLPRGLAMVQTSKTDHFGCAQ